MTPSQRLSGADVSSDVGSTSLRQYVEAVAVTLLGWAGRELLTPVLGPTALPFISFFPAVAAATWRGGLGPGILSVALSIVIVLWRFLLIGNGAPGTSADVVAVLAFTLAATVIVGPIAALRRARGQLRGQLEESRRVAAELSAGRAAEIRLAAIVESSGDAIVTKSLDGVVQTWNASAERLFGYRGEEIIGQPITMLIPTDRMNEEIEILSRLRGGRPVEHMETVRVGQDGRHIRVSISVSPLRDSAGQLVGASKIVHDITDVVEAREALERERQLLKTTLASIGDAVIVTDTEGRVTFLNAIAERLTGWSDAEAATQPLPKVFRIINEETRETVENPVDKVRRLGTVVGLANHTILIDKDGRETPIDDSAAPIQQGGRYFGVVLVFRDVSDRKRAEETSRLADRRKDEFLAILSHELRNPLNPIQLAATMLKKMGPQPPEFMQLRDIIDRQTRQLARLLDDLLDVSRITSGKVTLRSERIGLAAAVAAAIEASRGIVAEHEHQLIVTMPSEPIEVEGDVARLAQVVGNLVNNAAKFTDRGGGIEVILERQGDEALIRVRDNGIGIAPDQWPDVFEMFAQGDRSLERSQGGLGVGLSLARTLVELHHGTLTGFSEGRGLGSEFVVRLPIVRDPKPEEPSAPPAESVSLTKSLKILIADDNLDSATTLGLALRLAGHEVQTVADGVAAVHLVGEFSPDVVILDIGMPELNGYDVARRIRADYGPEIVLLAVTGWGQEEDKRRARDAGIDHHLTKPATVATILQLLNDRGRR